MSILYRRVVPSVLLLLVFFASFSIITQNVKADWLGGWGYRKSHTIFGTTAGQQNDYQIEIKVHRTTGTDGIPTANDVYVSTQCQADFGDIRFTMSDETTELSYWIEDISGDVATFWVNIPDIPASPGAETIYIYYGTGWTSATTSDGPATFQFFDDFSGGSLDPQWNDVVGSPTVSGGVLEVNQGDRTRSTGQSFLYPRRVRFRGRVTAGRETNARARIGLSNSGLGSNYWAGDAAYVQLPYNTQVRRVSANGGATTGVNMQTAVVGQWYDIELEWESSSSVRYSVDDSVFGQSTTNIPNQNSYPRIECTATANTNTQVDWYFVSNYANPEPAHGSWGSEETPEPWLDGWIYRKSHIITGSTAGDQTDYQISIMVYNITGTDSGADVYVGSKAKLNFGDVRFTDSSGSGVLDYWVEELGSNYAKFWVKVPYIPVNPSTETIYIYYGNFSQTSASDGPATFQFFDDFSGGSLDPQWNDVVGSPTVSGGVLEVNQGDRTRSTGQSFLYPRRVRFRGRVTAGRETNARARIGLSNSGLGSNYWAGDAAYVQLPYNTQIRRVSANGGATTGVNMQTATQWQWYDIEIEWESSSSVRYSVDDSVFGQSTTNIPNQNSYPRVECTATANTNTQVDWYFVSNYATPEPAHGSWGSEESSIVDPTPSFSYLSYSGDLDRMGVSWIAEYNESTIDLIDVNCKLNEEWCNLQESTPELNESWIDLSGLVGYWKFNEGDGTDINDSSGNGNDGISQVSGKNQVSNPSFENDKQGWGGGAGTWDIVTDEVYHKSKASRFQDLTGDIGHEATSWVYLPVTPGQDITLSLYSKGDNIVKGPGAGWYYALLIGRWCTAAFDCSSTTFPSPYPDLRIGDGTGTWDWKRSSTVLTPRPNAAYYRFAIGMRGDSTGTLWVDAVQLEHGDTLTEFVDGPWLSGADCKYGSCLGFDGYNDYATIPDSPSLDLDEITMSAWIYPKSYSNDQRIISKEWGTSQPYNVYTFLLSGTGESKLEFRIALNEEVNRHRITSDNDILLDEWTHVAATFNSTASVLYINGEFEKADYTVSGTIRDNDRDVYIGASEFYSPRYFNGTIDEAHIWDRALTSDEIHDIYEEAPKYSQMSGSGSCEFLPPPYNLTADLGAGPRSVLNVLNCTACNSNNQTLCDEWVETFYPISFEANMPNEVTLPVGGTEAIPVTVINGGLLTDSYTLDLVSMNPSALGIINGSETLELLDTDDIQEARIEIVMLTSEQKATARLNVSSVIEPGISFQKFMSVVGHERSLPDFGGLGILQIMIIAVVLLGFYYSDDSNN
jgi:hypothetical protein